MENLQLSTILGILLLIILNENFFFFFSFFSVVALVKWRDSFQEPGSCTRSLVAPRFEFNRRSRDQISRGAGGGNTYRETNCGHACNYASVSGRFIARTFRFRANKGHAPYRVRTELQNLLAYVMDAESRGEGRREGRKKKKRRKIRRKISDRFSYAYSAYLRKLLSAPVNSTQHIHKVFIQAIAPQTFCGSRNICFPLTRNSIPMKNNALDNEERNNSLQLATEYSIERI